MEKDERSIRGDKKTAELSGNRKTRPDRRKI